MTGDATRDTAGDAPRGIGGVLPGDTRLHPRRDDAGRLVRIERASRASSLEAWLDPDAIASVVPGGPMPASLNGVAFAPWHDAPTDPQGWAEVTGRRRIPDEPPLAGLPGRAPAAGAVIAEPDGRIWLVAPTNGWGGQPLAFPKGRLDGDVPPQVDAIREVHEECGLRIEIIGLLGDFRRTATITRYYLARRIGGTPSDMGWESQAVWLAPMRRLRELLPSPSDRPLLAALLG